MGRGKPPADGGPVVFSIVDDHPDLCYGVLGRLPRENSSFAAGVMAATVGELLARDAAETRRSDVVLLDLQLKDGSAPVQNIARLKAAEYPVVIYTDEGRPERRVAGPVLDRAASAQGPDPDLSMAAALASATLRDELLAPGFLTPALAERVRVARTAGARITVDFARPGDAALVATARELLGAALADLGDDGDITLQVHPPAAGHPALLILHARSRLSSYLALRQRAREGCAEVSDLGDGELLVRL